MMQLITKLLIIGVVAGGYMWLVHTPPTHGGGAGVGVLLGWAFVVVPVVYVTWRVEL